MTTKAQSTTTKLEASEPTLEPCKFCGRRSKIEEFFIDNDPQPWYVATCEVCPVTTYDQTTPEEAARIWNTRVSANGVPTVDQRRLEIALRYIKRAANRELPKLPCRVDEMTEREVAIFKVGAAAVGNIQFIARELDALPSAASTVAPQQSDFDNFRCECGHLFTVHQRPPVGTPWDICSFPCLKCECQEFMEKEN